MAVAAPSPGGTSPDIQAQNDLARAMIVDSAVNLLIPIYNTTITNYVPGQSYNVTVPVRPVGLIRRFWIQVLATVGNAASETLTKTALGASNFFSQVVLNDLNNQQRISTTGWHLHMLATSRRQLAFGAAFASSDPTSIGQNLSLLTTPSPVTADQSLSFWYEVPVAYSDTNLRGAIWANVVNATMNLQLTINPNLVAATGTNSVLSVYSSSTADVGTWPSIQINVWQDCLDQLPRDEQTKSVILPTLDLQYAYMLNNTNVAGLAVNQAQNIAYANWRAFFSTFVVYDNAGTLNPGTDISRIQLQSANFTNFFDTTPAMNGLLTRTKINDDFAGGVYYIDTRQKPINTLQYGNTQLVITPSTVTGATSQFLVGFESLSYQAVMNQAGSIYQN